MIIDNVSAACGQNQRIGLIEFRCADGTFQGLAINRQRGDAHAFQEIILQETALSSANERGIKINVATIIDHPVACHVPKEVTGRPMTTLYQAHAPAAQRERRFPLE